MMQLPSWMNFQCFGSGFLGLCSSCGCGAVAPRTTACGLGPSCREQAPWNVGQSDYKTFARAYEAFEMRAPLPGSAATDNLESWVNLIMEDQCKRIVPPLSDDQRQLLQESTLTLCRSLASGVVHMVNGSERRVFITDEWKGLVIEGYAPLPFKRLESIQLDTTWQSFIAMLIFELPQEASSAAFNFAFNQLDARMMFLLTVKVLRQLAKRGKKRKKTKEKIRGSALDLREVSKDSADFISGGSQGRAQSSWQTPKKGRDSDEASDRFQDRPQHRRSRGQSLSRQSSFDSLTSLTSPGRNVRHGASPSHQSKRGSSSKAREETTPSHQSRGGSPSKDREQTKPRRSPGMDRGSLSRRDQDADEAWSGINVEKPSNISDRSCNNSERGGAASIYSGRSLSPDPDTLAFRPGTSVCIHGLVAMPSLNGEIGVCQRWDELCQRWHVALKSGDVKSIKPENLTVADSAGRTHGIECVICLVAPAVMAFVPCGHQCICIKCAERLSEELQEKCPQCRQSSSGLIRIYS